MQSLNQKLETAAAALIDAVNLGFPAQKGLFNPAKRLPSVTVAVSGGQESPIGSGNFILTLSVECRTNAADFSVAEHEELCDEALEPMMSDALHVELAVANPELLVLGVTNRQSRQTVDEKAFVTELSMDVVCCAPN